jgi:hypothetical protein
VIVILPVVVEREVACITLDADGNKRVLTWRTMPCAVRVIPRGDLLAADIYVDDDQIEYVPLKLSVLEKRLEGL